MKRARQKKRRATTTTTSQRANGLISGFIEHQNMPKREWKNQHASRAGRGGPVVDEGAASTTAGSLAAGDGVYRSLDPLDPRRVSLDIFEAYCQEMLATKSVARRAYLITKMRVSDRTIF
jgi:hypothetical protein